MEEKVMYYAICTKKGPPEVGEIVTLTSEMIENAPLFDTDKEASDYCDLINPDYTWIIMPDR